HSGEHPPAQTGTRPAQAPAGLPPGQGRRRGVGHAEVSRFSRVCARSAPNLRRQPGSWLRNFAASGAATFPPTPPPSTSTAKARLPRKPTNHAWVLGGVALPNSAVPVLPDTGVPGSPARTPVPEGSDTTRPISV